MIPVLSDLYFGAGAVFVQIAVKTATYNANLSANCLKVSAYEQYTPLERQN